MNKSLISWAVAALAIGNIGLAQAEGVPEGSLTPKAQYAADSQAAQARYKTDLKLCADEPEPAGRMQCKRDAKAEYDQALADAKLRQLMMSMSEAIRTIAYKVGAGCWAVARSLWQQGQRNWGSLLQGLGTVASA